MESVLLEISLRSDALRAAGISARDEIEDELEIVLTQRHLGEVTGGGSGQGFVAKDVEVFEVNRVEEAEQLIEQVLT